MLNKIWKQQKEYNEKIFKIEGADEPNYWSRQYLLGITSQVAEVLREIKWKRHRNEEAKRIIPLNVLEQIADIMKFTLSLAQVWGFSQEELLEAMYEKGEVLDFKLKMEFKEPLIGRKILITDVDGTLADYRYSFLHWLGEQGLDIDAAEVPSVLSDISLDIRYPEYYKLKEKFEEEGGYRNLAPYIDSASALKYMQNSGYYIIAVTARPIYIYKRIFKDTLYWFRRHHMPIDELHMLGVERILLASELNENNDVIFWEDDPDMLTRASNSGINTFARRQRYNSNLSLQNVSIVDSYV